MPFPRPVQSEHTWVGSRLIRRARRFFEKEVASEDGDEEGEEDERDERGSLSVEELIADGDC